MGLPLAPIAVNEMLLLVSTRDTCRHKTLSSKHYIIIECVKQKLNLSLQVLLITEKKDIFQGYMNICLKCIRYNCLIVCCHGNDGKMKGLNLDLYYNTLKVR